MICYFGHGNHNELIAFSGIPPAGQRTVAGVPHASIFSNSVVLAVACFSGHTLGPATISAGAQGFLGFDVPVIWYPKLAATATAVGRCIEDMAAKAARLVQTHQRSELKAGLIVTLDSHINYWNTQAAIGRPNAGVASNLLGRLRAGFVVL